MTYLPSTPVTELATRADIQALERRLDDRGDGLDARMERLEGEVRHLSHRLDDAVDRLSQRMDRRHYTMMASSLSPPPSSPPDSWADTESKQPAATGAEPCRLDPITHHSAEGRARRGLLDGRKGSTRR